MYQFNEPPLEGYIPADPQTTPALKKNWRGIASWAMFFSVFGFIRLALFVVLIAISIGGAYSFSKNAGSAGALAWVILLGIVGAVFLTAFLVHYYHFRFATLLERAIHSNSQTVFEQAWLNLRNHFRIFGILAVAIVLLLMALLVYIRMRFGTIVIPVYI